MVRLKSEAGFTMAELLIVAVILAFTMAAVVGIYQVTQRVTLFAGAGEAAQLTARAVLVRLAADFQLINAGRSSTTPAPLGFITAATASSITLLGDVDNSLDAGGALITLSAQANSGASSVTVSAPAAGTTLSDLFPCGIPITLADGPVMETHPLASSGCVSSNTLTLASGQTLLTYYPAGSLVHSVETVSYAWDSATGTLCRSVGTACTAPFTAAQAIASDVTSFQLTYRNSTGGTIASTSTQANRDLIRAVSIQISIRGQSGDQVVSRTMDVAIRPRNL